MLKEHQQSLSIDIERMTRFVADGAIGSVIDLEIPNNFLSNPQDAEFFERLQPAVAKWLESINISSSDASNISSRLSGRFAVALADEWRERPSHYQGSLGAFKTPFDDASKFEKDQYSYRAYLSGLIEESVFDETFSLRQIMLPLRCTWEDVKKERKPNRPDADFLKKPEHLVGWLHDKVTDWILQDKSKSPVCLIKGGPGSGKSSYAKFLAGYLASSGVRVIFIPLHLINIKSSVEDSIEEYLTAAGHFSSFSLDEFTKSKCVLIFDGLDELQLQGRLSQETAHSFMAELMRFLQTKNSSRRNVIAVVTGRDVAIQSTDSVVRSQGFSLNVAPYSFTNRHADRISDDADKSIRDLDQRDEWWLNYGKLIGVSYEKMPDQLRVGELDEITVHPLLNYLVALAIKQGLVVDKNTDINSVYRYLLQAVYERAWSDSAHPALRDLQFSDFMRLLEEVAICVWHGAGRTTTMMEVEKHCRANGMSGLLDSLKAGATSGVSKILLAFYFREQGTREDGEKTFEFTHKSFAEYLIATRIVRLIDQVTKRLAENGVDRDAGWDVTACLLRWIDVTGKSPIDNYVFPFIRREILSRDTSAGQWQNCISELLSVALNSRLPMHRANLPTYREMCEYERNAEEALFVCVNACARTTEKVTKLNVVGSTAIAEAIRRIQGQRSGPTNRLIQSCLSFFDFSDNCFDSADLYNADLSNSVMKNAELNLAILVSANAENCDFNGAQFFKANVDEIHVNGAKFSSPMDEISDAIVSSATHGKNAKQKLRGRGVTGNSAGRRNKEK
ncbi:AAA family ATPase [Sphingomonas sp. R647]|nr:AAA family ATPase [Sphingomonas sp. R647]MCA1197060.1 AAA family ATPase [Sphingomonas sp. R647]